MAQGSGGAVYVAGFSTTAGGDNDFTTIKYSRAVGPLLSMQKAGGALVLSWPNPAFSLQSAGSINGAYSNILGATSPYTNPVLATRVFRLISYWTVECIVLAFANGRANANSLQSSAALPAYAAVGGEGLSCRRRQRTGHDHAAFGVVADIESATVSARWRMILAHALRLVEILPQTRPVIFDSQDDLAVCAPNQLRSVWPSRFGGVVDAFLRVRYN
jgi:hypothetical protein